MGEEERGDAWLKAWVTFHIEGQSASIIHCRSDLLGLENKTLGSVEAWLQKGGHPWVQAKFMNHLVPRLSFWSTADGVTLYRFGGTTYEPAYGSYPSSIAELQQRLVDNIKEKLGIFANPNSCLVNFYRDGKDSVSPHSDNEPIFGDINRPKTIISVSLGATRGFKIQPKKTSAKAAILASPAWEKLAGGKGKKSFTLVLEDGDIVLMGGHFQEYFLHSIPKSRDCTGGRFNLTFREVVTFPSSPSSTSAEPKLTSRSGRGPANKKARVGAMD